jgi:5-methylcytosine-specific restriction endonuclease McrA
MCPVCKKKLELNENNFYIKKNKRNYYSQCKICVNIRSKLSVQNFKLECVKYKGGKCELCGYNKLPQALQFHHKNPKEKDFQISNRFTRDMEKVKPELDKCQLLCANCHAEIEAMKPRKGDIKIGYNTETKETCIKGMFQSKDGSIGKIALITWKN